MAKVKKPKVEKSTVLQTNARKFQRELLGGTVLCFDPSSGSKGSLPGYTLFQGGCFMECGKISLPIGVDLHIRLQALLRCLQKEFQAPDILIIEKLPPFMQSRKTEGGSGGGAFMSGGVVALHKSVGVIVSAWEVPRLIEIAPVSWHSYARKIEEELGRPYHKDDDTDSLIMALATFTAAGIEREITESIRKKLTGE